MRFLFTTLLLSTFASSSLAQDHLLWFTGKKIKENVLVTISGDTLYYTPSKGVLRLSSSKTKKGTSLDRMRMEMDRTGRRIKETLQKLSPGLPKAALPMLAQQVRYGYEGVQRQYKDVLDNRLQLPEMDIPQQEKPVKGPGYNEGQGDDILQMVKDSLQKLEQYMEAHKNEVFTSVPVPPRQDFSYCSPCRPEIEENFKQEISRMERELAGDDFQMMQLALSTSRVAALFLGGTEEEKAIQSSCYNVVDFLMIRYNKKVRLLYTTWGEDPYRLAAVLHAVFTISRFNQLMGCSQPMDMDILDMVKYTMVKFLNKAMDENDYSIALNLNLFLNFSRTCQLLLGSFETDVEVVERALKFNRFKMDIHISGKIGADGGYQLAELKAANWFLAIPDSLCRLQWILIEPLVNKMQGEIVASDWRGNGVVITYAGPTKWHSAIPKMRMDFCKKDESLKDTVDIYQFDAEGYDEKWNMPHVGVMKVLAMNNPLMNTFINMDQMRAQAEAFKKDPKAIEKLKKEMMAEYQKMAKNNQLQSISAGGQLNHENMEAIGRLQMASRSITDMIYKAAPNKYHFEPVMHNKQKVILDEKLNGKELFPENAATQYAWFFLKMVHEPNGPLGGYF